MPTEKATLKGKSLQFIFWAAAIFLSSVVLSQETIEPYMAMRLMVLSGILIAYLTVFYLFFKRSFFKISNPSNQLFFGGLLAFGIWQIITSILSAQPVEAFLPITKYFLFSTFLFLLFQNFKTQKNITTFFKLFTVMGIFHASTALIQYFTTKSTVDFSANMGWFLGHRNLLGSYLSATIFFSIYLFINKKGVWKIIGFAGTGLSLVAILLSQSRSAWLAVLVGMAVWMSLSFLKRETKSLNIKSVILPLAALLFISIGAIVLLSGSEERNSLSKRIQSIVKLETAGNETEPEAGSIAFRIKTWKQSLSMIGDHPITGVGSGSWKINIPKYGRGSYQESAGQISRAKAHNEYLHLTSENGIIGLLLLMGLVFLIVRNASVSTSFDNELFILVPALTALSVDALFSFPFDRIAHLSVLAFCIAAILFIVEKERISTHPKNKNWLLVGLFLTAIFGLFLGTELFKFEKYIKLSSSNFYQANHLEAIKNGKKAKSIFFGVSRKGDPAELFIGMAQQMSDDVEPGLETLESALKKHPNNPRIHNAIGTLFNYKKEYITATPYFEKGLTFAPDYDVLKKNLIVNYFRTERYRDCINISETLNIEDNKTLKAMYLKSFELELLQQNPDWK